MCLIRNKNIFRTFVRFWANIRWIFWRSATKSQTTPALVNANFHILCLTSCLSSENAAFRWFFMKFFSANGHNVRQIQMRKFAMVVMLMNTSQNQTKINIFSLNRFIGSTHCNGKNETFTHCEFIEEFCIHTLNCIDFSLQRVQLQW